MVPKNYPEDQNESHKMLYLADIITWSRDTDKKITVVQNQCIWDVGYIVKFKKYHGRWILATRKYWEGWKQAEKLWDNSRRGNYNIRTSYKAYRITTTTNGRKDRREKILWPTKQYLDKWHNKRHWNEEWPASWIQKKVAWSRSQPRTRGDTSVKPQSYRIVRFLDRTTGFDLANVRPIGNVCYDLQKRSHTAIGLFCWWYVIVRLVVRVIARSTTLGEYRWQDPSYHWKAYD